MVVLLTMGSGILSQRRKERPPLEQPSVQDMVAVKRLGGGVDPMDVLTCMSVDKKGWVYWTTPFPPTFGDLVWDHGTGGG